MLVQEGQHRQYQTVAKKELSVYWNAYIQLVFAKAIKIECHIDEMSVNIIQWQSLPDPHLNKNEKKMEHWKL